MRERDVETPGSEGDTTELGSWWKAQEAANEALVQHEQQQQHVECSRITDDNDIPHPRKLNSSSSLGTLYPPASKRPPLSNSRSAASLVGVAPRTHWNKRVSFASTSRANSIASQTREQLAHLALFTAPSMGSNLQEVRKRARFSTEASQGQRMQQLEALRFVRRGRQSGRGPDDISTGASPQSASFAYLPPKMIKESKSAFFFLLAARFLQSKTK